MDINKYKSPRLKRRGKTMYYKKICPQNPSIQHMKNPNLGCFRILHALPNGKNVDVYLNDKLILENLCYCSCTKYMPMCAENYKLSFYVTETKTSPIIVDLLKIHEDEMQTLTLIKSTNNANILTIIDDSMSIDPQISMIRFIHLSPNAPAVDITLPDGTILFETISYQQSTPYISVSPTSYTLQVREAGTSNILLTLTNVTLEPNKYYSVNAVGLFDGEPELEALILLDAE